MDTIGREVQVHWHASGLGVLEHAFEPEVREHWHASEVCTIVVARVAADEDMHAKVRDAIDVAANEMAARESAEHGRGSRHVFWSSVERLSQHRLVPDQPT